jgi:hypothetical protein
MGPRCSSDETQVCHRSYIIAARLEHKTDKMYCKVCLKYEKTFFCKFTIKIPPPTQAIYTALVTRTTKILKGLVKFLRLQVLWTSILKKFVSNPVYTPILTDNPPILLTNDSSVAAKGKAGHMTSSAFQSFSGFIIYKF